MNRVTVFLLGVMVGALGLYVSENFYVVRSNESVHLVPKIASKLEFPYYDIREYTPEDWNENPSLAIANLENLEKIWESIQLFFASLLSGFERIVTSIFGSSNARYIKKLEESRDGQHVLVHDRPSHGRTGKISALRNSSRGNGFLAHPCFRGRREHLRLDPDGGAS